MKLFDFLGRLTSRRTNQIKFILKCPIIKHQHEIMIMLLCLERKRLFVEQMVLLNIN